MLQHYKGEFLEVNLNKVNNLSIRFLGEDFEFILADQKWDNKKFTSIDIPYDTPINVKQIKFVNQTFRIFTKEGKTFLISDAANVQYKLKSLLLLLNKQLAAFTVVIAKNRGRTSIQCTDVTRKYFFGLVNYDCMDPTLKDLETFYWNRIVDPSIIKEKDIIIIDKNDKQYIKRIKKINKDYFIVNCDSAPENPLPHLNPVMKNEVVGLYKGSLFYLPDYFDYNYFFNILFFINSNCNFACPMCTNKPIRGKELLSLDRILQTINEIKLHNLENRVRITLYGGEPTLNWEHLQNCRKLFKEHLPNAKVTLTSNGYFTNYPDFEQRIKDLNVDFLHLSCSRDHFNQGNKSWIDKCIAARLPNMYFNITGNCEHLYKLDKTKLVTQKQSVRTLKTLPKRCKVCAILVTNDYYSLDCPYQMKGMQCIFPSFAECLSGYFLRTSKKNTCACYYNKEGTL